MQRYTSRRLFLVLSSLALSSAFSPALRSPLLATSAPASTRASCLRSSVSAGTSVMPVSRTTASSVLSLQASATESTTQLPAPPAPGQLTAPELVKWLWNEAQFRDDYPACSMDFFADDVLYEDMVYADPFVGKEAVRVRDRANQTHEALFAAQTAMLIKTKELAPPDFVFVLDRVGDGSKCCGFTWHIEYQPLSQFHTLVSWLSTRPDAGKFANGMSMYELNDEIGTRLLLLGKICYVRDLVEPFPKTGDFGLKVANFAGKLLKMTPPPEPKE